MENRVWWVQCKPFSPEDRESDICQNFQQECIDKNFFGMGWKWPDFKKYEGMKFSDEIAQKLCEFIKQQPGEKIRSFSNAQNKYKKINMGDVVLTRLKNNFYAGVVRFRPKMSNHEYLTWYSEVNDTWTLLGTNEDLPHHIRGVITSKKCRGTITEINGLSAYTIAKAVGINCPKIKINADSFVEALGDEDLEDLMAHYMRKQNPNYVFLPSSCKKNTPGIEYVMYCPETNHTISCQTKVNSEINVREYLEKSCYRKYETVYLFSGSGYENCNNLEMPGENIKIVKNKDLFETLKCNEYFKTIISPYFDID